MEPADAALLWRQGRAMYAGAVRSGFRLVHYAAYALMANHVHLIVEAPNRGRLS